MSQLTLKLPLGMARDFPLQAQNTDGTIPDVFLDTDTLATTVSLGLGQPSLLAPTTTWTSAGTAQFQVSFNNSDTAGVLSPGVYRIQTTATRSGRSALILNARLQVLAVPGSDAAIPVYTAWDDLLDRAPWIVDLQGSGDEAETWFLRQQGLARQWLDEILIQRYSYGDTAPMIGSPGFGLWSLFAGGVDFAPSKWIRDELAANTLMIRGSTIDIVANRALFYICEPQLGKQGDISYRELARQFARRASNWLKTYRAELDLNGDGYADIIIDCGSTALR